MIKYNQRRNVEREIKRIDRRQELVVKKILKTLGYGFLIGASIYVIGFILGTIFYCDEGTLYRKIDEISIKMTHATYYLTGLTTIPFFVRFFKLENQKDILESIQKQ